jgi:hypothetical protein
MRRWCHSRKFIVAWIFIIAIAIQIMGFLRYLERLPGDWLGIIFYIITIMLLTILVTLLLMQSNNRTINTT